MENLVTDKSFKALLDAAVDGIFIIDHLGLVHVSNKAVESLLGYDQEELIGRNVSMLMPSPYKENHDEYLRAHLRSGENKIIGIGREVEAQHKNGEIIEIFLSVGKFSSGDSVLFVGIIRDIRELKKRDVELAKAQHEIHDLINRLSHISRIGVMGEMAASIAHEVNQPLTAISSYAQAASRLLASDTDQLEEVQSALEKISGQALRAGEIIRSLRSWIREQDDKREDCDCNVLISEVINIVKIEARNSNLELQLQFDHELPAVMCDPIQIQQVVLNLIKNAIDAMSITAHKDEINNNKIFISTESQGNDRVQIMITDHGPGVSTDAIDSLFQPFFTTKETGMGMGLSICRTIIRAHGGELDFINNASGGTSFYFVLPTAVGKA